MAGAGAGEGRWRRSRAVLGRGGMRTGAAGARAGRLRTASCEDVERSGRGDALAGSDGSEGGTLGSRYTVGDSLS